MNSGIMVWRCHYLLFCVLHNKMDLDMQSQLFTIRFVSSKPKLNYNNVPGPTTHCFHNFEVTWGIWNHPLKVYGFIYNFICIHAHKELSTTWVIDSSTHTKDVYLQRRGNSPETTALPSPRINQDRPTYASITNTGQSNPTPNRSRVTSNSTTNHNDKKLILI